MMSALTACELFHKQFFYLCQSCYSMSILSLVCGKRPFFQFSYSASTALKSLFSGKNSTVEMLSSGAFC